MQLPNYSALEDGSLKYEGPFLVDNKFWKTDPADTTHVIPQVPVCVKRRVELRVLPSCGRKRATWFCDLFQKKVSVKECHECQTSLST